MSRMPYFSMMALAIALRATVGLGTFAVTDAGIMLYDPAVAEAWDVVKVSFVFAHELFHKWLKHAKRRMILGIVGDWQGMLWNIAADAYINMILSKVYGWAPSDCVLPERLPAVPFAGFQLPKNVTAEEAYRILLAAFPPPPPNAVEGEAGDGEDETAKPEACKGWCGSAAGRAHPEEGEEAPADDPDGRGEAEFDAIIEDTARAIRDQAQKNRGSVPEEIGRHADELNEPAVIAWHRQLRVLGSNAVATVAGAVDYRFGKGLSVRQAGLGYGDGVPMLPKLIAPVVIVMIATDTSGSMGSHELGEAVRESRPIFRMMGTKLVFIACDCAVHKIEEVKGWQAMADKFHGGGGTSFVPVFEAIAKMRRKPDVLIFYTDGMGNAPAEKPAGFQTIWVLLGQHQQIPIGEGSGKPITWGKHIFVPPTEAAV